MSEVLLLFIHWYQTAPKYLEKTPCLIVCINNVATKNKILYLTMIHIGELHVIKNMEISSWLQGIRMD